MSNNSWIIILFLLTSAICYGQEVVFTNQATVEWDAVTTLVDDTPIPVDDVITYEVFTRVNDVEASVGVTPATIYTLTFNSEGRYIIGVRALRYIQAVDVTIESAINWSDVNGESTPEIFVILYILAPKEPDNLGVQ